MSRGESGAERILQRILSEQEEEREWIAKVLHDDLGQQVASLSILASLLKRRIPESEAEAADRIREKLGALGESMRQLSQHLYPTVLEHAGVVPALRVLCAEFAGAETLRVAFGSTGNFGGLQFSASLVLFRIVQDVLQSVRRCAMPADVSVRLDQSGGMIDLTIRDSGPGLSTAIADSDRAVMLTVCHRAKSIRADVRLERDSSGSQLKLTCAVPMRVGA